MADSLQGAFVGLIFVVCLAIGVWIGRGPRG